jgi:ectoine hydroxylase-related dioxygenase (phytanoyl-CoA dioxygenase family)
MLTEPQRSHYETFGFLALRQVFSPDEIQAISSAFDEVMLEDREGKPFDGRERQSVHDWFHLRPATEKLPDDPRIHGPIEQLLGPGYTFEMGNDGNYYIGDTGWHPDSGWDPCVPEGRNDPYHLAMKRKRYRTAIKVALYLDPVGSDTGCLRVIPGSHRSPWHEQLWSLHLDIPDRALALEHVRPKMLEMWERDTGGPEGGEQLLTDPDVNHFGLDPCDVPAFAIESQPGDVVFFSYQLWHASFGGRSGRRMFTLNFSAA